MSSEAVDLNSDRNAEVVNLAPAGPPPTFVMQSDKLRLTWDSTAFGLQPTRIELLDGSAAYEFADFPVWRVEFQDSVGQPKEVLSPSDFGPEHATVNRITREQWTVRWNVDGLVIEYTITMAGDEVRWGFKVDTNDSGRRVNSVVMPAIRFKRSSSTTREERAVIPSLACGIQPRLELLGSGLTSPLFDDLPTFGLDSPGFMSLDLAGYYAKGTGHYFMQWTTDEVGSIKRWLLGNDGGTSETAQTHFGIQHFVGGRDPGNTWTSPHEVWWTIGKGEAGHEWYDMAERWREWAESLSPAPAWMQEHEFSEDVTNALLVAAHYSVEDEANATADPVTPSTSRQAIIGQEFLEFPLMTTHPAQGDLIAVPSWDGLNGYYRVAGSEDVGTITRVDLDRPLQFYAAQGLTVRFHGPSDRLEQNCPTQMLNSADRLATYLGIEPSQLLDLWYPWGGSADVWAFDDPRRTGMPFYEGNTGVPSDLKQALADAKEKGLSIGVYAIIVLMAQGRVADALGLAERSIIKSDGTSSPEIVTLFNSGPDDRVNLDGEDIQEFISDHWRAIAYDLGASGAYLDAHNGPSVFVDLGPSVDQSADATPTKMQNGIIGSAESFRDECRAARESDAYLQDELGNVLEDDNGDPIELDAAPLARPNFWTSSEYKNQWTMGSIDLNASKYTLLRTLGLTPVPEFWRVAVGGHRQPVFDLTDCYTTNRIRVADAGDFDATTALVRLGQLMHGYHAGQIPSLICIGEVQDLTASDFLKGTSDGSTLHPYEKVITESVRDHVQWDKLDRVRAFRRSGKLERPIIGGEFLDALISSDDVALVSTGLTMASAYTHEEHAGILMLIIGSWNLFGTQSIDVDITSDRFPIEDGGGVYEVSHDGTETQVGTVENGSAKIAGTLEPGMSAVYEVK